ncbi:MAG: hypothetical protein IPN34_13415 [Planctomycetes bacterium]|nr:hypothetical protein [Planctomycetota bacterium]
MRRKEERGAILMLAVMLGGLLAALTLSLLAVSSFEARGSANAESASAARRLARAGVEIAAARWQAGAHAAHSERIALGPDQEIGLDLDPMRSPSVRVVARSGSARCSLEAEIRLDSLLREHALAVFGSGSTFAAPTIIQGSAYFAAREQPFEGEPQLDLSGDLELTGAGLALPGVRFAHVGRLLASRRVAELPQLDLAALQAELERRAIPVQRLEGGGTWKDLRFEGVLLVELERDQELVLENLVLDGALVAHAVGLTAEQLATETAHARVVLRGASRLRARTELLGSLALAAPCIEWRLSGAGTTQIEGLALVGVARDLHDLEIRGALWVRGAVHAHHRVALRLPLDETLVLPEALLAPPSFASAHIEWR